ncbi:hypothetical protein EON67_07595 [archaeon]|nr:MAG: hypothetical protein EON67_07595 [archaeon]
MQNKGRQSAASSPAPQKTSRTPRLNDGNRVGKLRSVHNARTTRAGSARAFHARGPNARGSGDFCTPCCRGGTWFVPPRTHSSATPRATALRTRGALARNLVPCPLQPYQLLPHQQRVLPPPRASLVHASASAARKFAARAPVSVPPHFLHTSSRVVPRVRTRARALCTALLPSVCTLPADTRKVRDACVVGKGEAACAEEIRAHNACLRADGFDV